MSYNPAIHDPTQNRSKPVSRQTISPNAGIKHSDIVKANASSSIAYNAAKVKTASGFSVTLAEGPDFTVRQEHIAGGNNTGLKTNKKGDISILVQHGVLFVNIKDGEAIVTTRLITGQSVFIKRGTVYGVATLANEYAEVLATESPNYGKTLQMVAQPEATNDVVIEAGRASQVIHKIDNSKTLAQAQEIAAVRARRVASTRAVRETNATGTVNANSGNSIGVNLRAAIPTEE